MFAMSAAEEEEGEEGPSHIGAAKASTTPDDVLTVGAVGRRCMMSDGNISGASPRKGAASATGAGSVSMAGEATAWLLWGTLLRARLYALNKPV
mmetsp:Transcript_9576/g.24081  ORF Transcript_9576/g.24081 Transcript_9576/m.24081 type:complete len:94 (-) Transcript_9576:1395-1676(-)